MVCVEVLSPLVRYSLIIISLLLVGFGQPVWPWIIGLVASCVGFALFFRVLLDFPRGKDRFWLAAGWFGGVQLIQLFWMVSHPFSYIYAVYLIFAVLTGLQFGVMGLLVRPRLFERWIAMLGFAGLWALMEWSRLFFLSGYSWNPVGLLVTGNVYGLQAASLAGVFGLSFWVIFINLVFLRAWLLRPVYGSVVVGVVLAAAPLAFGYYHISTHEVKLAEAPRFKALLVQTAFPAEEILEFKEFKHYVAFVMDEWRQILSITQKHAGQSIDLIALPEYVVPFGSYSFIYPYEVVKHAFIRTYGPEAVDKLPAKELPFVKSVETSQGTMLAVNNAFWIQSLANLLDAPVIAGLEDAEDTDGGRERYSAALYFTPQDHEPSSNDNRYSKRVLVPMAEYIPFSFCRAMAAEYGIHGSFICGTEAQVYKASGVPFGVSICYEETFGEMMVESRRSGAELLVNLTSDVWFPNSLLPYQHLEHARLRSVEAGVPMVRACNTGVTSSVDSLGRTVSVLGDNRQEQEWSSACLLADVPLYAYSTPYTFFGDKLIVIISLGLSLLWAGFSLLKIDPLF